MEQKAQPKFTINVVELMLTKMRLGDKIVPGWNLPQSTGTVANRARSRPREYDGRLAMHSTPSTNTVLRALRRAEAAGEVECVGTGEQHCRAINKSTTDAKERYWRLTDAVLAQATP